MLTLIHVLMLERPNVLPIQLQELKPCFHSTCQNEYVSRQIFSLDLTREENQKTGGPQRGLARSLVGSVIRGRVKEVKALSAEVETESGLVGQVHATSMNLSEHIGTWIGSDTQCLVGVRISYITQSMLE